MQWFKNWRTERKLKKMRAMFRAHHTAAALCAKNRNASGHQLHFQKMREIYAEMRELEPGCPPWQMTRNEARLEKRRLGKRQQPTHGPRLKSAKAKQTSLKEK